MNLCVKPAFAASHSLAIAVIAIVAVTNSAAHKSVRSTASDVVNIDLYYESLCYDSIQFVKNQLIPVQRELGNYTKVTYIPYGKATHEKVTDKDGVEKWQFSCQHGASECYGNKAQACGIDDILTNPDTQNKQQDLANFVGCVMSARNPSHAVPTCLETIGVDETHRSLVNDCISSTKGDELLARYGDKTYSLQPNIGFVPTIVFNGVYSHDNQRNALYNLKSTLCSYIPAHIRPTNCSV